MVKFGQRLAEELVKEGWEASYVQYSALKKLIKGISEYEVTGDIMLSFEKQEKFLSTLMGNVSAVSAFYIERSQELTQAVAAVRQSALELQIVTSTKTPEVPEKLEGIAVMDELARVGQDVHELRMFAVVNREAVRKILKKHRKKTSSATTEVHSVLDRVLEGTALNESHEVEQKLIAALGMLSDAQAQIALKSRAHAAYMSRAVADNVLPVSRPSNASSGKHESNHGGGEQSLHADLEGVVVVEDDTRARPARECQLNLCCGLKWITRCEIADWWSQPRKRLQMVVMYALGLLVLGCMVAIIFAQPTRLGSLSVIGTYASILTAVANGANDIANSVGTSVGAKALTLKQAITFGIIAEVLGAMTLGSLVAKTISKGVIAPEAFAAQECVGVLKFGVSMVCVLCGTGLTTLLATLYGLPISASHGVIGGLIAVGLVANGPESLGVESIVKTLLAWVASPAIGALSAAMCYWIILYLVHRSKTPGRRAAIMQPFFVAVTVAVAAGFIVIKGPDALKIKPVGVGVAASIGIGAGVGLLTFVYRTLRATALGARLASNASFGTKQAAPAGAYESTIPKPAGGEGGGEGAGVTSSTAESPPRLSSATDRAEAARQLELSEKPFVPLLILSALTVAFAHGANDVGNSVGPLAAIFEATLNGSIASTPQIPIWVLAIGSGGFVVGIAALGSRTIATVGGKITTLTPSKSFSVQIGAAVAVLSSTVLGLAVSTSHCLVGSVVGVGLASRISHAGGSLNGSMLLKIFIGWGVTIPLAMLVAIIFYFIVMPFYGYTDEELLSLHALGDNATCY